MFLRELESVEVRNDLPGALQRAIDDVPRLEEIHRAAEKRVELAEEQRVKLQQRLSLLNREIKNTGDRVLTLKKLWMESMVDGEENVNARRDYLNARQRKGDLVDALAFLANYAQEDNTREGLLAAIEEAEARANVLDASSARQRIAVIAGAASSAAYDPGAAITFPEDAWSTRAATEANDLRSITVKGLAKQLVEHDAGVASRRNLIYTQLFT
jgi:hypothetical protein